MPVAGWGDGEKASADALRVRSAAIRLEGVYLGFLEWVAWGLLFKKNVVLVFGDYLMDVLTVFAPLQVPDEIRVTWDTCRIGVVRCTGSPDEWRSAVGNEPEVNHFVIGELVSTSASAFSGDCASSGRVPLCAKAAALRLGVMLKPTVAQGDCGPDTMSYFLGRPRTMASWLTIRGEIADFIAKHADDPAWALIGATCQESQQSNASAHPNGLGSYRRMVVPASAMPSIPMAITAHPASSTIAAIPTTASVDTPANDPADSLILVDEPDLNRQLSSVEDPLQHELVATGEDASAVSPCVPVRLVSGSERFRKWIKGLGPEDLSDATATLDKWCAAERSYLEGLVKRQAEQEPLPRLKFPPTKRVTRLALGAHYARWLLTPSGKESKAPHRDFLVATREDCRHHVDKKHKMHLARCWKAWQAQEEDTRGLGACLPRSRKPSNARARIPDHLLSRGRGKQGRPFKSPELRDLLWDWFVDIRASVAGIMSPKLVLMKAKDIADRLLRVQRQTGCYAPIPQLSRMWLLRWKRDKVRP